MSRAILTHEADSSKMFFQQQDNAYRYFYRRAVYNGHQRVRAGRLSLQVTKARMHAFRTAGTLQTKAALDVVSILSQGGGWYTIQSEDLRHLDARFGTAHDGLRMFLAAWNAFWNAAVQQAGRPRIWREEPKTRDAAPARTNAVNTTPASISRLQQLAARFARA